MADKVIYAMYDDDGKLLNSASELVKKGVRVRDVFSPFPIHGIDPVIGIKQTRLGDCAFIFGLIGLSLALIGIRFFMITDWPMNIGGKPNFSFIENIPTFVPISFEFTVLCAAHGMAITMLIRNKTLPFMPARNPDPRTTNDKFVMEIRTEDNHGITDSDLTEWIKETSILEYREESYEVNNDQF